MIQFDSFMQAEGVPIYQQIIRYVKQGIAAGTIRDGEELPSRSQKLRPRRCRTGGGAATGTDRDGAACHGPQHEAHGAGQAECLDPV